MRQSILFEVELYVVLPRFPLVLFDYFVTVVLVFSITYLHFYILYIVVCSSPIEVVTYLVDTSCNKLLFIFDLI